MKNLLASTAALVALSTTAMADAHTSAFNDMPYDNAVNIYASELIGSRVYASEADIENNQVTMDGQNEWDDIGEINEIVLTRSGEVQSVIVGVGGFLGMGEKDVSINMDQLQFVTEEGELDDYFLVVKASAAGVEEAPSYERNMATDADMDMDEEVEVDANADANADVVDTDTTMVEVENDRSPLMVPSVERDGYSNVAREDLNTEDLTGARVYGAGDEDIGEVSELLIDDSGQINRAVIDVGGFLGMGEHSIAVPLEELQITREDDGDDVRVYIDSSQEALEAQPEYEG